MIRSNEPAQQWAEQAATLPIAFAQVREDPRLDVELVSRLPARPVVVMIASGGDTAIQVGRCRPAQLHLVDMNPAQLALTRLKWHLAERVSTERACALLGHTPLDSSDRAAQLKQVLSELGLAPDALGPLHQVANWGPDFSGRYERTFAELRGKLSPIAPRILRALESHDSPASCPLDAPTAAGRILDDAFRSVMSLSNLVCLFGRDATQNPRQAFASHFAWRTRLSLARSDRVRNPFLWQMLLGQFPPNSAYDWLLPESKEKPLPSSAPRLHCGRIEDVLLTLSPASVDLVHLSNILDWLCPSQAAKILHRAHRVLKPKGRLIVRQLNSTLDIPSLKSPIRWDSELSEQLTERDRSFFYPNVFVGSAG